MIKIQSKKKENALLAEGISWDGPEVKRVSKICENIKNSLDKLDEKS